MVALRIAFILMMKLTVIIKNTNNDSMYYMIVRIIKMFTIIRILMITGVRWWHHE